jgi:hypothetical protein
MSGVNNKNVYTAAMFIFSLTVTERSEAKRGYKEEWI